MNYVNWHQIQESFACAMLNTQFPWFTAGCDSILSDILDVCVVSLVYLFWSIIWVTNLREQIPFLPASFSVTVQCLSCGNNGKQNGLAAAPGDGDILRYTESQMCLLWMATWITDWRSGICNHFHGNKWPATESMNGQKFRRRRTKRSALCSHLNAEGKHRRNIRTFPRLNIVITLDVIWFTGGG